MKKRTRRIITVISSFVLALSTTFAAFAGTSDNEKLTVVDNVNFYIFSPIGTDKEIKEEVMKNPLLDSPATKWTNLTDGMKGSIAYAEADYREYEIENSYNQAEKKGGYIAVENVGSIVTKAPTDEAIKKAVESKWSSFKYDTTKYGIKWIVAKYAHNTLHVDGVVVPLSELETTTEETTTEEETPETTTVQETTTEKETPETTTAQETTTKKEIPETTTAQETTTEKETSETTTVQETTTAQGVVIIDDDVPRSDGKETTAGGIVIDDDDVPLSDGKAPQTGDNTKMWSFMLIAVLAAGTIVAVNAKKEEN